MKGPIPKEIRTRKQHAVCMTEVKRLMNKDPDPAGRIGKRLAILVTVVENYEKIHFPIAKPTGEELRRFREEQGHGGVG